MRVLFYVDTGGSTGGPGMHSVRIWRAFQERWPELTGPLVIPGGAEDRRIFGSQIGDANVRELGTSMLVDPGANPVQVRASFYAELCALARREGCDHVHVLWGFLHPDQIAATPDNDRLPLTITLCDATGHAEHDDVDAMYFGSDRWESYLREVLKVPAGYLAISERTRQDALKKDVPASIVETIHLWIDPKLASQKSTEHEAYVAFVGGLAEYKGIGHVLDFALAYPEYPIKVSGYPSSDFPIDWKRYPSFDFFGYVAYAEVIRMLARARALLYVSYSEGFGLPMLEAQTLGVPLIVNPRNMMVRELLASGSYVSAGNVGSPTSIKAAIDVATRDRDEIVRAGFENAARFEEDRQIRRFKDALERTYARLREAGWGS